MDIRIIILNYYIFAVNIYREMKQHSGMTLITGVQN